MFFIEHGAQTLSSPSDDHYGKRATVHWFVSVQMQSEWVTATIGDAHCQYYSRHEWNEIANAKQTESVCEIIEASLTTSIKIILLLRDDCMCSTCGTNIKVYHLLYVSIEYILSMEIFFQYKTYVINATIFKNN